MKTFIAVLIMTAGLAYAAGSFVHVVNVNVSRRLQCVDPSAPSVCVARTIVEVSR